MKKQYLLLSILSILLITTSCSETSSNQELSSSLNNTSETSTSEPIVELTTDPVSRCTISDILIDINVGRWLCVGIEYTGSVSFSDLVDQTATIESSHPDIIEISINSSNNKITFNPKKAGDTILKIYDKDGVLRYRNVIKARNKIEQDDITDYMINVDHFKSYGINGDSKITFLSSSNGVFSGFDSTTNLGNINFSYEFTGVSKFSNDEYEFIITEWKNEINDLVLQKIYIDFTGCMLHLMTPNITVDVYFPVL